MALKCFDPTTMAKLPCATPPIPRFSPPTSTSSHRLHISRRIRSHTVSSTSFSCTPRGLGGSAFRNRHSFLRLATPHDDSAPIDVEINRMSTFEQGKQSENEPWKLVLASFISKTIELYRISKQAFEIYWRTTMPVLKKAAKDLKIEAVKTRYDLSVIAQELGEEARHYIALAAENSPEPLKEVVETFRSCESIPHVSQIHDFYIGVPYGGILSLSGFLDFMITGRTAAVRFGMILGGVLLALSVSSLRSWRRGETIDGAILKCEIAIVGILFLREFRLLFQKLSFPGMISTAISGAVAAFFIYRMIKAKESNIDIEPQTLWN